MAIFDFRQKNSTVILSMLGVKFQKNKNITFLVCNKGISSREERLLVDSPFKVSKKWELFGQDPDPQFLRFQIHFDQKYADSDPKHCPSESETLVKITISKMSTFMMFNVSW